MARLPMGAGEQATATISYKVVRASVLDRLRRGEATRAEVCDAHPELLRAAVHHGDEIESVCPVCGDGRLRQVSYVFGPRLPAHGRCITLPGEVERIRARPGSFTRYLVEVCVVCRWNHLDRAEPL